VSSRIAIHVLDVNLEHAYKDGFVLKLSNWLGVSFAQRLPNNILRWVVVDDLFVCACHSNCLVALEVFRFSCSTLCSPLNFIFSALFVEQRQNLDNFGQHRNILLILHILINGVALTLLDEVCALLCGEGLKPVAEASELVGRRWQCVNVLADLLVLHAKFECLKHRIDAEFNSSALGFEHITQKAFALALYDTRLVRESLLVNVRNAGDT